MAGRINCLGAGVVWGVLLTAQIGLAADDAQALLDKATDLKLKAGTLQDLSEVASLCEQAIKKGLNAEDDAFARKLLTGTLYQRVQPQSRLLLQSPQLTPALQEHRKSALADLHKIVQYDDTFGHAYLMIAQLEELQGGDRAQARQAVERAIELLGGDKKSLSEAYILRGQLHESEESRQADFDRAVEIDPENPLVWQARALYFLSRGEVQKAIDDFNSLLTKDSENLVARLALAEALIKLEKADEALEHVNHIIETQPNILAYTLRAQIWTRENQLDKAIEDIDAALKIAPDDFGLILMRARLYHATEQDEQAKADVEKVLQAQPAFVPGIELRASILASLGQFDQAAQDIAALVKRDPSNILLKLQQAIYLNAAGESQQAIELFTAILQEDQENGVACRGRADAYLNVGAHKEAVADYEVALKKAEDDSGILNNFAWVLATSPDDSLRDGKRAIELGLKACELTEYKEAHILSTLAAAYAEAGDFTNARKWAQKAVELGDDSVKSQLQQELESYRQDKPWRERKDESGPSAEGQTPSAEKHSSQEPGEPSDTNSSEGSRSDGAPQF